MFYIIGSGLGGTTVALILKKLNYPVQILEQHTNFGGCLHTFKKNGYLFEVGLHYMGNPAKKLWSFLTDGKIHFCKVKGPHDIFFVNDEQWSFGEKNEQIKLYIKLFGSKKTKKYINLLCKVQRSFTVYLVLNLIFGLRIGQFICNYFTPTVIMMMNKSVVDILTNDIQLDKKSIGILTYFWGNVGLLPSNMSFLMHTILTTHWWDGHYYPCGGSERLATYIRQNVKNNKIPIYLGETVIKYNEKENILQTERGMRNKNSYSPDNIIVSCGLRSWAKINNTEIPTGCVSTFMIHIALYGTPEELNLPSYNLWVGNSLDVENDWELWDSPEKNPPICFISFCCAKDITFNSELSTACIICPCKSEWTQDSNFKTTLNNTLIDIFKKKFPNLTIVDSYAGSPCTFDNYIGSVNGSIYGTEKTGKINYNNNNSRIYYSGQDVFMPGITAAAVGGFLCARQIDWKSLLFAHILI